MIDLDALIPGSAYFRWREATYQNKWGIHAYPTPEIHKNIIWFAKNVADPIHNLFGKPVQVHRWWSPKAYNDLIGGAPGSEHLRAMAFDFSIYTVVPDEIRSVLKPRLEAMGMRMEIDTPFHVHVDARKVAAGESRTFSPLRP